MFRRPPHPSHHLVCLYSFSRSRQKHSLFEHSLLHHIQLHLKDTQENNWFITTERNSLKRWRCWSVFFFCVIICRLRVEAGVDHLVSLVRRSSCEPTSTIHDDHHIPILMSFRSPRWNKRREKIIIVYSLCVSFQPLKKVQRHSLVAIVTVKQRDSRRGRQRHPEG